MNIIFMGTPIFACGILQALIDEKYNVVAVVSQPDKKVGRKQEVVNTPVKKLALQHNIPVIQPERIKEDYDEILSYKPDLIITCAYGQMVPEVILNYPKYGCVNVHASLLPKYRGGAPIHKCIIDGETQTGITIMKMVKKMDAGCMYLQNTVDILEEETTETLHDKLVIAGSELIKEFIPLYINGKINGVEQDENLVTYAYNISKEDEFVSFCKEDIKNIYNQIRGLISWPVGYGIINNRRIKFHKVRINLCNHDYKYGEVIGYDDGMQIACNGGIICIDELQLEGKAKMSYKDFINGYGKTLIGLCFE